MKSITERLLATIAALGTEVADFGEHLCNTATNKPDAEKAQVMEKVRALRKAVAEISAK